MEITTNPSGNISSNIDIIVAHAFDEYHHYIRNYISSKIQSKFDAEDLTQDVFVRLLDHKQMLREETVKSFLFTIAHNLVIDYIRRHYKKQEVFADMVEFIEIFDNQIEKRMFAKDIEILESNKLKTFTPQRKLVYIMSRFDNMSVEDISSNLNISKRTAECHLFTGRKAMREFLKKCL